MREFLSIALAASVGPYVALAVDPSRTDVCRAVIATMMTVDIERISSTGERDGVVFVSYERDGSRWQFACKGQGDSFDWASIDSLGPGSGIKWRQGKYLGAAFSYRVKGDIVSVKHLGQEKSYAFR